MLGKKRREQLSAATRMVKLHDAITNETFWIRVATIESIGANTEEGIHEWNAWVRTITERQYLVQESLDEVIRRVANA